jgi:hypothetical protein
MGWARLVKLVFDIDLEHCPQGGGENRGQARFCRERLINARSRAAIARLSLSG